MKPWGRRTRLAVAVFIMCWFCWFAWSGLLAGFAPDDMMNLHGYWKAGWAQAVYGQFLIGTNIYRPMGALFYLPLFDLFGLNPLPFRIVIFGLLLLNVWLAWRVARVLGCGEAAAALAALVTCYHAGLADLHYSTAVVYDILCFTFYWCAFLFYAGVRVWNWRRGAVFLALYIAALNSKEMAVTLPLVLLAYEWLYREKRDLRPAAAAAVLTAVYIAGKVFGADPLMRLDSYHPVFTAARFFESSTLYLNQLFYAGRSFTAARALALWLVTALGAWWTRRTVLRFCWFLIVVSPLPIVFLAGRTHSCLYIPLLGWAIFLAEAFTLAASWIAQRTRRPRGVLAGLTVLAVVLLARTTVRERKRLLPEISTHGALTRAVLAQFRAADPHVAPGSRVLLLNDPFQDWDAKFIAELWFRDPTVDVRLQRMTPFTDAEIAREMQYVFRFTGAQLVREKPAQ